MERTFTDYPRMGRAEEDIPTGGSGTVLLDRPETDDGDTGDYGDWFVIKGERPWRTLCGRTGTFMAESRCPHRIIVWPDENDPNLLKALKLMRDEDREDGEVKPYEKSMGACVSFYSMQPS